MRNPNVRGSNPAVATFSTLAYSFFSVFLSSLIIHEGIYVKDQFKTVETFSKSSGGLSRVLQYAQLKGVRGNTRAQAWLCHRYYRCATGYACIISMVMFCVVTIALVKGPPQLYYMSWYTLFNLRYGKNQALLQRCFQRRACVHHESLPRTCMYMAAAIPTQGKLTRITPREMRLLRLGLGQNINMTDKSLARWL